MQFIIFNASSVKFLLFDIIQYLPGTEFQLKKDTAEHWMPQQEVIRKYGI